MRIEFTGHIKPEDFDRVVAVAMGGLATEGVAKISSETLDFLAWGAEGERRQAVDSDGYMATLTIPGEELAAIPTVVQLQAPETVTFRDRPEDMEFSMFNIGAGRDD